MCVDFYKKGIKVSQNNAEIMNYLTDKENRKLYWVVAIFILLGICIVSLIHLGEKIQAGLRGYISGEAEWSKAQKTGTIALIEYIRTEDINYYKSFEESVYVIYGDRMARETLSSDNPNLERAKNGLLMGNNHPEDIDAMIWIFLNFHDFEQIKSAINYWIQGDEGIDQLVELADSVHDLIAEGKLSETGKEKYYANLRDIDNELTVIEQQFTLAMSSAARWAGHLVFWTTSILSILLIILTAFTAVTFMRDYRKTNDRLKESEQKFKNVLDHSRDVIYQISIGSEKYDYVSSSVNDLLGYRAEEIMDGGPAFILDRIHPDDTGKMKQKIQQLESDEVEKKLIHDSEFRVKKSDGTYIWVNNKRSLLKDSDGNPAAIVGNVRDITLHKQQMEILDKSLVEKQTLLAEIHHRVKNNLAIISSLIELQKDEVEPDVQQSFQVVQSRIKSIALIHEKLYENTVFSEVELSDYIHELTDMISNTYQSKQKDININFELEDIKVDMTTAVPVGLICNELINNCFKHAFNNLQKGEIVIRLRNRCDYVSLEVSDDGKGLPPGFEFANANGLGMTLLKVLTQQLDGEIKIQSEKITSFNLLFPISANEKAEMQPA